MAILKPKVQASGLIDVLGMAAVKQVEERITSPFIGNATIKSGLIKLIGGGVGYSVLGHNRIANVVTSAVVFDGAEDIMAAVLGGMGNGSDVSADNW